MKKKIVAFLLTLTMVLSLCTTFAYAKSMSFSERRLKIADGIGKVAGAMEEAIGRQPDAAGDLIRAFDRTVVGMALGPVSKLATLLTFNLWKASSTDLAQ